MGLFNTFMQGFNQARSAQRSNQRAIQCVTNIRPWNVPHPQFEAIPACDEKKQIYVYDPSALAGVYVGQEIIVEAFTGFVTLTSSVTGYQVDCGGDFDIAVMYNGRIFGSTRVDPKKVFEAAQHGYALKFRAVADGVLPEYGNILDLQMYCPNKLYLYGLIPGIEDDRPLRMRENVIRYYLRDEKEYAPLASRDKWELENISIEFMPVKKGSKAKPSIAVYTQEGQMITSASARRGCYADLVYMKENYTSYKAVAEREIYDDSQNAVYTILIIGSK